MIKVNKLWLMIISFGILQAAPIDADVAEQNALKWMKSKNHKDYTIKKELFANGSTQVTRAKKQHKYKILELEPKGWIIVSLDDVIKHIVGYGDSEINSNLPPAMIEYLDNIEKTIDYLNTHPKVLKKRRSEKLLYGANDYGYVVRPLLWMGSTADTEAQGIRWNQGTYYNALTPVDANGDHTWTGCVATAMGQLMRYWEYPSVGVGENQYTPSTHPEYGEQHVDFSSATYDWANMPLRLTSDNVAVAQALYHAGVAVNMDYTPEGSGAWLGDRLKKYFNYKLSIELSASSYMASEWSALLKNELDKSRPIMYSGFNPNGGGHQFIIDGYDTDGYYHFNWGWGGYENGKFTLENIDYSDNQDAYIIAPVDPSPQVAIADSNFASCIVEELSLEDSSEIRELSLKYSSDLDCSGKDIDSVEGLSYFKNIRYLYLDNNNIRTLLLPNKESGYEFLNVGYNSQLNILEIENLKNIETLYAYGTKSIACWQKNTLVIENNITNIHMNCSSSAGDDLDTDGDGISNVDDPDDDNDGINDLVDDDIDGDGVNNSEDIFPLDPSKSAYKVLELDTNATGNIEVSKFEYYTLHVSAGQKIKILLGGLSSDLDLYVKQGEVPTSSVNDCLSAHGGTAEEECILEITSNVDLFVGVYGYESGSYSLGATIVVDTDGDGIFDNEDTDDDNDGVLDINDAFPLDASESVDTDGDGIGNNTDTDDDNDGISDALEIENGLNPLDVSDAEGDLDHDGFSNAMEIQIGTDIHNASSKPIWVPIIMGDIVTFVPALP